MSPDAFELILRQAAWRARKHRPEWLDTDDLTQSAQLAILEAQAAGKVEPVTDPLHLRNKTRMRAFGAMLDEIRASFKQAPGVVASYDDTGAMELAHGVAPEDQERTLQLKQAIANLVHKGSPQMLECIALLAEGLSTQEVGQILQVSASRVSQLRGEARRLIDLR